MEATPPKPLLLQTTPIPWSNTVRYLGILLDSKLLFSKHLLNARHRATGTFLKLFPLLSRDSPLNLTNKLLIYKLILRSMCTYAAPVWSATSLTNLQQLQIFQSKCLRVIGDYPRRTPIHILHSELHIPTIAQFILRITDKFFSQCPAHANPLIQHIGNYTLQDLHLQYSKYRHKRIKHILL